MLHGSGNAAPIDAVDRGIEAVRAFAPGVLVLPLGFDTDMDDPISVLNVDLDAYRAIGARIGALRLPLGVVQEGGYLVEAIGSALDRFLAG